MGLATAYQISKTSDSEILVLDRYGVGNEYCSSNDINRVFRYSYGNDQLYTKMAVESLKLWRELEQQSSQQLLIQTGLLLIQGEDMNANSFNESSYHTLSRMKLGAERLNKDDLKRRFPQFRSEEAFFDRHGGVLLASKALLTLQSMAQSNGVKLQQGHANAIVLDDPPYLTTEAHEKLEFQRLVVTTGPWSGSLLREGLSRVRPTRQQLMYIRPKTGLDLFKPQSCPVFFTDKHYGLPAAGIDAVKISPKELDETADPDIANRAVDDRQIIECRNACRKFVPIIADGDIERTKICFYDMTDNSDFVLDKDPKHPNMIYGYGFSGHGFKFAPLIGRLLSDLALDRETGFDLARFSAVPSRRRTLSTRSHLGQGQ